MNTFKLTKIIFFTTIICLFVYGYGFADDTSQDAWIDDGSDVVTNNAGNVGIGLGTSVSPESLLHLPLDSTIQIGNTFITAYDWTGFGVLSIFSNYAYMDGEDLAATGDGAFLYLESNNSVFGSYVESTETLTEHLRIDGDTGNVGIGTSNPQSKLDVNGTLTAAGINITDGSYRMLEPGTTLNATLLDHEGVTFILPPGVYEIDGTIWLGNDRISIIGFPGTVLEKTADARIVVNGNYCLLKDFEIDGGGYTGELCSLGGTAEGNGNKFEGLTISNCWAHGIVLQDSTKNHVINCTIIGNEGVGIYINGGSKHHIEGNIVSDNGSDGISFNTSSTQCVVTGNIVNSNGQKYGSGGGISGAGISYCIISNNFVEGQGVQPIGGHNGIYVGTFGDTSPVNPHHNIISNNVAANNQGYGIRLNTITTGGDTHNVVVGNACDGNITDAIYIDNIIDNKVALNSGVVADVMGNLTIHNPEGDETINFGSDGTNYLFDESGDIKWHNTTGDFTIDKTED